MVTRRRRSLVFFHIPKCGGTSVTAVLKSLFRHAVTRGGHLSGACLRSRPGGTDVLHHGHPVHGAASHVPEGALTATLLRTPAEQAISNYCHLLRSPDLLLHEPAMEMGFSELMRTHWHFWCSRRSRSTSPSPRSRSRRPRPRDVPAQGGKADGHAPPPSPDRLNASNPVLQRVNVSRLRREFDALSDDPRLRSLMAAEASLAPAPCSGRPAG